MKFLKKYISIVDKLNEFIGKTVSYVVLLLMLVIVFEVVSRRFFNRPTLWAFEVILMIYAAHFMLVSAYGLLNNSIVAVDLITAKLSPKNRHIVNLITYTVFFYPFIIFTIHPAINFAWLSLSTNEHSWSVWAPPLFPIKAIIPITLILLLLQGTSQYFKTIVFLMEHKKTAIQ